MSGPARRANLLEAFRAVAWSTGVLLCIGAVALPVAHAHIYVAGFKSDLTDAVAAMATAQRGELIRRERFSPDAAAAAVAHDTRILARATLEADGRLRLLAMTAPEAVRTAWLPALIYERRMAADGTLSEGRWLTEH